jgi:hypothetical protein
MNLDLQLFQEIEKILGEQLEQQAAELVSGKASDYSDYRYRVGRIRGIQNALEAAREAQKRVLGIGETRER